MQMTMSDFSVKNGNWISLQNKVFRSEKRYGIYVCCRELMESFLYLNISPFHLFKLSFSKKSEVSSTWNRTKKCGRKGSSTKYCFYPSQSIFLKFACASSPSCHPPSFINYGREFFQPEGGFSMRCLSVPSTFYWIFSTFGKIWSPKMCSGVFRMQLWISSWKRFAEIQ